MIRALLLVFVTSVALCAARGSADFGGLPAARALQAWWSARQFESAALHEDLDGLARLGRELERIGAGDGPLRFAAHRLGFQATGTSWNLPEVERRLRMRQALDLLEETIPTAGDPWEARLTQVLILVNRASEAALDPRAPELAAEWLASGGGPGYPFRHPGEAYRAALRLPPAARSHFLAERFRIGPAGSALED